MNILVNSTTQVLLVYNANMYLVPISYSTSYIQHILVCYAIWWNTIPHCENCESQYFCGFAYFLSSELDKMDWMNKPFIYTNETAILFISFQSRYNCQSSLPKRVWYFFLIPHEFDLGTIIP